MIGLRPILQGLLAYIAWAQPETAYADVVTGSQDYDYSYANTANPVADSPYFDSHGSFACPFEARQSVRRM